MQDKSGFFEQNKAATGVMEVDGAANLKRRASSSHADERPTRRIRVSTTRLYLNLTITNS